MGLSNFETKNSILLHGFSNWREQKQRKGTNSALPLSLSLVEKEKSCTQCPSSKLFYHLIVFHLVILHGSNSRRSYKTKQWKHWSSRSWFAMNPNPVKYFIAKFSCVSVNLCYYRPFFFLFPFLCHWTQKGREKKHAASRALIMKLT